MTTTAALLLSTGAGADRAIDHYGGGGVQLSPDGHWRVWSRPPDADEADTAPLWLSGPGVPRRLLLYYARRAEAIWLADRRHVLIRASSTHFDELALFDLAPRNKATSGSIERRMERIMAGRGPPLAQVQNREIVVGRRVTNTPCVAVRETGLPSGRREGSFLQRRGFFRLDIERARVTAVAHCPGAILPH